MTSRLKNKLASKSKANKASRPSTGSNTHANTVDTDYEVIIVGAGISGISMACQLKLERPNATYTILERRQDMGGTWDLFRYPGIRSDSDMSTFGFSFRPWKGDSILASGAEIKQYVKDTAEEFGVSNKIQYGIKVNHADWCSESETWRIQGTNEATQEALELTCKFLVGATGYYNYDKGYQPDFKGQEDFEGQIVHPQHWPEDLDYTDKNVVVIGSGATAVTLIPAMAGKTRMITMLQRSPTYVASIPQKDPTHKLLKGKVSLDTIYQIARVRNIGFQRLTYAFAQRHPKIMRKLLLGDVKRQLKGKVDMKHFTPQYNPWDERLCAVPNGDLFKVLRSGDAQVVTDHIDYFDKTGIMLKSGKHLDADIIVTATGLSLQMMGGATVSLDNEPFEVSDHITYKGVLIEGLPNASVIFGYTNASWTLKATIAAQYTCRLLNYMQKHGYTQVEAVDLQNCATEDTVLGSLSAGYIARAINDLPKQGEGLPWEVQNNYLIDLPMLRYTPIAEKHLRFYTNGKLQKVKHKDKLTKLLNKVA